MWSILGLQYPALLPAGWDYGRMLCVVLRGHWEWALVVCESWQRLRSSRGRRKHKPRQQVREGGRGWGYCGWKGIQCTNSQSLSWLNQSFWCLSHPWICHSCLKMLWSIGKVWRVQPRAPCLCLWYGTPARFYLCQKRRPKSKLQWHSWPLGEGFLPLFRESPQLSPKKLGPSQWLTY